MSPRLRLPFSLPQLRRYLKRGGLVAYPTESSYGIGALPRHPKALKALLRLKKRPQHKGLIVIGGSLKQLAPLLAPLPPQDTAALNRIWPAARTFVLPAARVLPDLRGRRRQKLAVRVPDHPAARALCRAVRSPLVSTSCNRAGRRPCRSAAEARRLFGSQLAIVGGRTGGRKKPSEITDWQQGIRLR